MQRRNFIKRTSGIVSGGALVLSAGSASSATVVDKDYELDGCCSAGAWDSADDAGVYVNDDGERYYWTLWAEADLQSADEPNGGKEQEKVTIELEYKLWDTYSNSYQWISAGSTTAQYDGSTNGAGSTTEGADGSITSTNYSYATGDFRVSGDCWVYYADYHYPDDWDWKHVDSLSDSFSL